MKSIFHKTKKQQDVKIEKSEKFESEEFPNIRKYIDSSFINKKMRGTDPLSIEDQIFITDLTDELQAFPNYKGKVTRATKIDFDFENMYAKGTSIKENAFTSASIGEGATLMGDTIFYDILFIIDSKSAKNISKINPSEKEVIFLPNTEFSVTKIEGSFKFNDISMNENLSEYRFDGDNADYFESIAYSRSISKYQEYNKYFNDINLEKKKDTIEEEYDWVLDEWNMDISDIKTIHDLIKIGFDPVIEIH